MSVVVVGQVPLFWVILLELGSHVCSCCWSSALILGYFAGVRFSCL